MSDWYKGEIHHASTRQLCWKCVNAAPEGKHGCSWSRKFIPVEGWTAEEHGDSYNVKDCPEFVEDKLCVS